MRFIFCGDFVVEISLGGLRYCNGIDPLTRG